MTITDKIVEIHETIAAALWSTVVVAASVLNPKLQEMLGGLAPIASWFLLLTFLTASCLSASRITIAIIKRKWHELFGTLISEAFAFIWRELNELRKFFLFRIALGVITGVLGLLTIQWFRFHLDIFGIFRKLYELSGKIWAVLFDLPNLASLLHEWLNGLFIKTALDGILLYLVGCVQEDPWIGLFVIALVCIFLVVAVFLVKLFLACRDEIQLANAEPNNRPARRTNQ